MPEMNGTNMQDRDQIARDKRHEAYSDMAQNAMDMTKTMARGAWAITKNTWNVTKDACKVVVTTGGQIKDKMAQRLHEAQPGLVNKLKALAFGMGDFVKARFMPNREKAQQATMASEDLGNRARSAQTSFAERFGSAAARGMSMMATGIGKLREQVIQPAIDGFKRGYSMERAMPDISNIRTASVDAEMSRG